jgi:drug/metabolite transporter (DMT)-like permease
MKITDNHILGIGVISLIWPLVFIFTPLRAIKFPISGAYIFTFSSSIIIGLIPFFLSVKMKSKTTKAKIGILLGFAAVLIYAYFFWTTYNRMTSTIID